MSNSIHSFTTESIEGGTLNFADYKGRKILLVNTASECGFTPQYTQLQELHENFKDKVAVIGLPANEFGAQEPGSDAQIKEFCTVRYGVTFPLAKKQVVKGEGISPLYEWLTSKEKNGVKDINIRWNFHKIVLDENGVVVNDFAANISPFDEALMKTLEL